MGVHYDPAILSFKVFEQDDGAWRIEQSEIPPLKVVTKQGRRTIGIERR